MSSEKKLAEVLSLPFDEIVQIERRVLADQIRGLNKSIAELGEAIGKASSELEKHRSLTSIQGIGTTASAILLSVIGDVNDFPDEKRLASCFGIEPALRTPTRGITPAGFTNVELRWGGRRWCNRH